MARAVKIVRIKVDGTLLDVVPESVSMELGGENAIPINTHRANAAQQFEVMNGSLKFSAVLTPDVVIDDLRGEGKELSIEADNGMTWKMASASSSAIPDVQFDSGIVALEYVGNAIEQTA